MRRMVDKGSGVSIMTFSAFNCVPLQAGVALQLHRIDLYAANGKTLGGYKLETNFVVVDDAHGLEDFLLSRDFPRAKKVLVDLTVKKISAGPG